MRVSLGKITHPEGAELQLDTAPADWIADRLLPWGADVGTRVCAIVPVGYEAYLRVFHHAEEHVGSESIRRRWSELAQRSGRQMHPAVQFDRFAWPNPPQEGSLDRQEATALVSLLRAHTTTPNHCWLAIWHGFSQLTGSVQVQVVGGRGLRAWLQQRRAARSRRCADGVSPESGVLPVPRADQRRSALRAYAGAPSDAEYVVAGGPRVVRGDGNRLQLDARGVHAGVWCGITRQRPRGDRRVRGDPARHRWRHCQRQNDTGSAVRFQWSTRHRSKRHHPNATQHSIP